MLQLKSNSPVFRDGHKPIYTSEASSIGFPAGEWPAAFQWNDRIFHRTTAIYGGDRTQSELLYWIYKTEDGTTIKVWND